MDQRVEKGRVDDPATKSLEPSQDEPSEAGAAGGKSADQDPKSGRDGGDGDQRNVFSKHPLGFASAGVAAVAIGVGAYFYWQVAIYPFETTDDAFVDARNYTVAAKVSGYVAEVPVTDNQHVDAGGVLFQIDMRDYEVAVEQAKAMVEQSQAAIANVDAQIEGQKAQVAAAQDQVNEAQAALDFAQKDAARYDELAKSGYGTVKNQQSTSSDLRQKQASLAQSRASFVAAQKQVKTLEAQRASAEAELASNAAKLDQANLDLGYTTVRAAQSGRVVRLTGSKGQFAQGGTGLSNFVPDEIWVTANFKETQITDMRPGQQVDVEIDAYPGRDVKGRVDSVQPGSGTAFSLLPAENATGNYVKVTQRVPVKIVVENWPKDVSIGPGMSIVPRVHVR